jgi:hypothetical protein
MWIKFNNKGINGLVNLDYVITIEENKDNNDIFFKIDKEEIDGILVHVFNTEKCIDEIIKLLNKDIGNVLDLTKYLKIE